MYTNFIAMCYICCSAQFERIKNMTALIFVPIYIGLSVALTVIVADLLTPGKNRGQVVEKPENKRAVAA